MCSDGHYGTRHTKAEITHVLADIHKNICEGRFRILGKRAKNEAFFAEYNIRSEKQKEILLQIQVEDFCYSLQSTKEGYEGNLLYVFVPRVELYNIDGEKESVQIYIKFDIIEKTLGQTTIVISFHKLEKTIDYLFD